MKHLTVVCITKNKPVKIWVIKHKPNKDPKFHIDLIAAGVGNSIKDPLTILKRGWVFIKDVILLKPSYTEYLIKYFIK